MYLMAPDGEFLEFYTQLTEPHEVIESVTSIMRGRQASGADDAALAPAKEAGSA